MQYDIAIIGAGWAGFNAALRAKERGLKAVIIEQFSVGGTCLHRGCIPTKAIIQSAKIYSLAKKSAAFGVHIPAQEVRFSDVKARKDTLVRQLRQGMEGMLKGIEYINAAVELRSPNTLKTDTRQITADSIIIASGSEPMELAGLKFDGKRVVSSDDMLNLEQIPRSLLIVGAGVIGCEFACLFSTLGTQVSIVEKMPRILPLEDGDVSKKLETILKKKGVKIKTNTDIQTVDTSAYELILQCVGRRPRTALLGLDSVGVAVERGRIVVDDYLRTTVPNIFAAGDCTGRIMLAHYAAYQGKIAAENCGAAQPKPADNGNIPACIFTDPEIASVGLTEENARNKGLDVSVFKFDFLGSGMARILDETEGFIKIVSDTKTGMVLGASIIGPKATELISFFTLAVSARTSVSQIKDIVFPHPTLSEIIGVALRGYGV